MSKPKVYAHVPYIGSTGYNNHTRDFFRRLSKLVDIKVRNFTIGKSWNGYSDECHNDESYINDIDKKLLLEQTLNTGENKREEFPIYTKYKNNFNHNVNLILAETEHHYFYDKYIGPKIGYNIWESTLQPKDFFNRLLEYDQLWFPSQWQADCSIAQGADKNKVKVVPEGVDIDIFFPEEVELLEEYKDKKFKFILFGRFDYRKSTKEIIETFLSTFSPNEDVELIVSIDNPFSGDNHKTTEDRLKYYGFTDKRIKIKHFPSREDYISYLKTGHIFLSCARSEGWNLPLIEAMACGTPSIYSECSGQMEFAEGKGLPVKILGEKQAKDANYNHFATTVGNYYEPDFDDLSYVMRDAYINYQLHKEKALKDAKLIHKDFNWEKVADIGKNTLIEFINNYKKPKDNNKINLSYIEGPRVEINGEYEKEYLVEFIDSRNNKVIYSDNIKNNMWTCCNKKYYIPWIIKINGKVYDKLDLRNKTIFIEFSSSAIGDTIAWFPYIEEFRKKHKCKIICSTFYNHWFQNQYPKINFISPGDLFNKVDVIYKIGWFNKDGKWDDEYHSNSFLSQPLAKTCTDILDLQYKEIQPLVSFKNDESIIKEKYVTLSMQSTAQCKYWNHPTGWQQVVDYLNSKDYKIILVDKFTKFGVDGCENVAPKNIIDKSHLKFDEVISIISGAEFHLGISSGLSWIAWAANTPVVLISSFTKPYCEFTTNCTRIYNDTPTSGYFNTHKLDPGNWNWYPYKKLNNLEDWYEVENITPEQVINQIKKLL